jgi:hypothetical protein
MKEANQHLRRETNSKEGQNLRVFVKNMKGKALMPCTPRKARILLKDKKAKIIDYIPFTIQLLFATGETVQEIELGVDLGSKHVGVAITSENKILAKGEIELRQDIKSNIDVRRTLRRSRRNRKTRYRRSKFKFKTKRIYKPKSKNDKKKWKKVKLSYQSTRQEGWMSPSLQSKMDNIFFWIDKFRSLLPDPKLHNEVGKFNVQKMKNPDIQGREYQEGDTFGYHDVRYFVFARDNYTCQVCKKKNKILQTHHILYQSQGGSNAANNLISVCKDCHTHENHQPGNILWKWMQDKKKVKQFKEPPFMNSLRIRVYKRYTESHITYGSVTTPHRKNLKLEKTHYNDAIAITGIEYIKENEDSMFYIKQFRKKKRSLHEATARKGKKEKNKEQKRNEKNTKYSDGFYLNDKIIVFGQIGFVCGFASPGVYVKDIEGRYITIPGKYYKQIQIKDITFIHHQNNWQFISHLAPYGA